ncbi:hypothetical protein [Salinibacillus xinjiangensis]|uniref:DUF4367 domain-containing protein n=1 Tax=Salinibacillus xinjiangensis TaxID=1229268 RepID=A0A6G1XA38_9BACI|nr:hypothetical protein [Salinibacillus xinjiangensis]MRG87740.1 hypothetical protein [Salinibacillus xinjiangensis]
MNINRMKRYLVLGISIGLIFILSGCFLSEEKALENALEEAETEFNKEKAEVNQTIDVISLHLPGQMEIDGSSNNNVFLEEEGQDYLLFYNQFEGEDSKHLFEGIQAREDGLLLESFEQEGRFGFIAVFPNSKEEHYEIQVGIGGIKLTTLTTKDSLADEAKKMMNIVKSAKIENP